MTGFPIFLSRLLALILAVVPFASNAAEVVIKFATTTSGKHFYIESPEYLPLDD